MGQRWWNQVDFRFWNLDCGLKQFQFKAQLPQLFLVRNPKSKICTLSAGNHRNQKDLGLIGN